MSANIAYRVKLMKGKSKKIQGVRIFHGEVEDKIFVKLKMDTSDEKLEIIRQYFQDKFSKEVVFLFGDMDMMELERIE